MHFLFAARINKTYIAQGKKMKGGRIWLGLARSGPDRPSRLAGQPGGDRNGKGGLPSIRLDEDRWPTTVVLVGSCMCKRGPAPARVSLKGGSLRSSRSGEGWNRSRRGRGRQVQAQNLHAEARDGSRAPPVFRRLRQWHRRLRFSCMKSRAGEI
jgi:hypothetical protein